MSYLKCVGLTLALEILYAGFLVKKSFLEFLTEVYKGLLNLSRGSIRLRYERINGQCCESYLLSPGCKPRISCLGSDDCA